MSQQATTMGAYLRSARRRRRVSIERAAEDTKIRPDFLMRMESDEFDFLAPAYVRGFLRTYARFLHTDPDPLLEEFDRRHGVVKPDPQQIVALERRQNAVPRERSRFGGWALAASIAAVVLILLAIVGWAIGGDNPADDEEPRKGASAAATKEPSPSPTPTISPKVTPLGIVGLKELVVEVNAVSNKCWIEATIDGTELFSGVVREGSGRIFSARSTVELVLGFPAGVELVVNGKNLGAPGGVDPITVRLPDDLPKLGGEAAG